MKLRTSDKLALVMLLFPAALWASSYFVSISIPIDWKPVHAHINHDGGSLHLFIGSSWLGLGSVDMQWRIEANSTRQFVGRLGILADEWDRTYVIPGVEIHRLRWRTGETIVITNIPYLYVVAGVSLIWAALWFIRRRRGKRRMAPAQALIEPHNQ